MKVQYCSDLHLEFSLNEKFIKKYPLVVKADILLLAGDIVPFAQMDNHRYFFDWVSDNFQCAYWLPGNHEYYHADIAQRSGMVHEQIRNNIFLVNNVAVEREGVQFIFSTLWSKINPINAWEIERAMSDFHVIKNNGQRFSIDDFNRLHDNALQFIKDEVGQDSNKTKVVVTHHIPTFMNYPPKYKADVVSQAFATELSPFIEVSDIHTWIYGHHHTNMPPFKIGNTTVRTNQLGYVKYGENSLFERDTCFEI